MKMGIIGSGGVGGYFGAKIARAGYPVTFIARGAHLHAMKQKGLKINSINGDFLITNVTATDDITALSDADLIILGTKAWQVREIAGKLGPVVKDDAVILPLQNGVMAFEEISAEIGKEKVLGGLCRIMSKIEMPGVISHTGIEPVIIFGEMDNRKSRRIIELLHVFEKSGIKAKIADDIEAELWKKFINICVGGLLAITRSNYGQIREHKETRALMFELVEEIYAVSQKAGICINHEFVDKTIAFIDSFPYDSTSSLTRDIWEGKPSEIEYQNGSVARLGEKYDVKTPVNRFIYHCILPMERRAREAVISNQ